MNFYHRKFLNSFASENVIAVFSRFKNADKEITESWGMLEAAKNHIPDLSTYMVIVVGDGGSPRTGVLFSYFTKADVISIDPAMNLAHWDDHVEKQTKMGFPPQRIKVIKDRVENLKIDCKNKPVLVVWPHSHANMDNIHISNYTKRVDIAMPCCSPIPKKWMQIPHLVYEDYNISSPKRMIHIWGV